MALADAPFEDRVLERLGGRECPQRVRHRGTRLAKALGHLLLREIVGLHEELVGAGRLDRVEIRPLEVLDEGELEPVLDVVADDGRDGGPSGQSRREHPTVPRDELVDVALARYHYWLQDAVLADRRGKLGKALRVELRAWLPTIGRDLVERDLGRGRRNRRRGDRGLTEEDVQTAAETCSRHQAIAPPSAIGARLLSRAESSRARSSYAFAALEWRS